MNEKVFAEVSEVMKGDADVTQAHINQMPYLKAFVRETFRVWPNGTEVSRYTEKDIVSMSKTCRHWNWSGCLTGHTNVI